MPFTRTDYNADANTTTDRENKREEKMSNMKCPFCQQELDTGGYYVHCHNQHCNTTVEMEGTEEMWVALIRTRKALDKAKWWLHEIVESHRCTPISTAEKALAELTKGRKDE